MENTKKKKSLVDSFLFLNAKDAVDQASGKDKSYIQQAETRSVDHSIDIRIDGSIDQRVDGAVDSPTGQYTPQSIPQSIEKPTERPTQKKPKKTKEPPTQTSTQTSTQTPTHKQTETPTQTPTLVENEVILYTCLKILDTRTTTLTRIQHETKISANTLKGCLKRLKLKGMIAKYEGLKNESGQIGFSATISDLSFLLRGNPDKVNKIISKINFSALPVICDPLDNLLDDPVNDRLLSSSSFFLNKETTTNKTITEFQNNPEFGYWRQKGLAEKQIKGWQKEFNISQELILQYLCYCRFDMMDNDIEKKKPIQNVFNYFYKTMEKAGAYPQPKSYKSFQEKKLEEEKSLILKKEQMAKRAAELYKKKIKTERDREFWEMNEQSSWFNQLQVIAKAVSFSRFL